MKTVLNNCLLFIFLFFNCTFSLAQSDTSDYYHTNYLRYENFIYSDSIKTVVLERNGFQLSDPVVELFSGDQLLLTFDELGDEVKNYSYTFIHCNSDWTPSTISNSQYLQTFLDDRISEYQYSFNVKNQYIHYRLLFPNENMKPSFSGNYILKVFETDDPEKIILTRRWMMVENRVQINTNIKRATVIADRYSRQEIDFTVSHPSVLIQNPFNDVKITIMQNGRWDNAITNLKPLFLKDDLLDYTYDEENTFNGGNEFRTFDLRTMRFQTEFVKKILEDSAGYTVFVTDDQNRSALHYSVLDDINGKFLNKIYDDRNSEIEADYIHVRFKLLYPDPLTKATPYLFGELTDWHLTKEGKLKYNYEAQAYETELFLKQGYYNYEYVVVNDGSEVIDETVIEGNHFETENDYSIFVYFRTVGGRYDQLIGWKKLNSKNIF
jgi:hypothetical protein